MRMCGGSGGTSGSVDPTSAVGSGEDQDTGRQSGVPSGRKPFLVDVRQLVSQPEHGQPTVAVEQDGVLAVAVQQRIEQLVQELR